MKRAWLGQWQISFSNFLDYNRLVEWYSDESISVTTSPIVLWWQLFMAQIAIICLIAANYEWMIEESKGHASEYITSLIMFLQSVFLSFTNLPVSQTARAAFRHRNSNSMEISFHTHLYCNTVIATKFLYMARQPCCRGMCKNLLRCDCQQRNYSKGKFPSNLNCGQKIRITGDDRDNGGVLSYVSI